MKHLFSSREQQTPRMNSGHRMAWQARKLNVFIALGIILRDFGKKIKEDLTGRKDAVKKTRRDTGTADGKACRDVFPFDPGGEIIYSSALVQAKIDKDTPAYMK